MSSKPPGANTEGPGVLTGTWPEFAFGVALFVTAFAIRMRVALSLAAEPVWDGHYYDFGAKRIAEGQGYSDEIAGHWHAWCHYPVGYSGYLGVFYKLFGESPWVAHFADALAGGLLAVVAFLLAREALSPARSKIAGVLVALHPGLVLYGALVMTEPLSALLVLGAFWVALFVARRRPRWWEGPAAGALVLGVAALVRPQALMCAPFLALAARVPWKKKAMAAVIGCVVALVPVLPWTARNCRVMDGCALVSTNAGWNLAIGAFPRATGRFETLRSSDGCREVTGQVQQDRCWAAYGVDQILSHPWHWLSLSPAKLSFTFDHESFAVEYLREARPGMWPEERRVAVRKVTTTIHRVLMFVAVLAFLAFSRRHAVVVALFAGMAVAAFTADNPIFWPLVIVLSVVPWIPMRSGPKTEPALLMSVGLLATTAIAHVMFFGEDRYHMVVTPVLCILAAASLRLPRNAEGATPK